MASLFDTGILSVEGLAGEILVGAKLYFYENRTSTPKDTYGDISLSVPNANPVVGNAAGRFPAIWLDPTGYSFALTLATGDPTAPLVTRDDIGISASTTVSSIAALQALNGSGVIYLLLDGRSGQFQWFSGDYSAQVASDPLTGIYIPPASDPTGASGTWIRNWDGVNAIPEWFGAVKNSSVPAVTVTNAAAINAAIVVAPDLLLGPGDYYSSERILMVTPNRRLRGVSSLYNDVYGKYATRLLLTNGSGTVLQVGPDVNPGSIGMFPEGIQVFDLQVARSVAPVASSGCDAVKVQFVLEAYFEGVRGDESMNGWEFNGTVRTIAYNCTAKRSSAATGGADSWKGFYVNGSSGIAAGGNASLYLNMCNAADTRAVKTNSVGFYGDVKYTDLFIHEPETVSCTVGMQFIGNGSTGADNGNTDLQITSPTNDAFATFGIYFVDMNEAGSAEVMGGYYGPAAGATAALEVANCKGALNIIGGQFVMASAPACKGIKIEQSKGVTLAAPILSECTATAVELTDSSNCELNHRVKNNVVTGGAALQFNGACKANKVCPMVEGKASGSNIGIQILGTAIVFTGALVAATSANLTGNFSGATGTYTVVFSDTSVRDVAFTNGAAGVTWTGAVTASANATYIPSVRNEFNMSGIDSACINTGAGNKLLVAAASIAAVGTYGTNVVTGVTA